MPSSEDYKGQEPAWCPGCGNFPILKAFGEAMAELGLEPHQITLVSGVGQAAKLPHYTRANTFNGLHGRTLPVATGIRLANPSMTVICTTGDGDCYGEGGNHLIHAIRRNVNITLLVHDNQIYALTKGQASPTSTEGMKTKAQPTGALSEQLNPMALAVALDAGFAARSFAGDPAHLKETIKVGVGHNGFALIDILQPCVTFNKINTYEWYRERVYPIGEEHDPTDRLEAFRRALEWGDRIPLGVIFRNSRPAMEEKIPVIKDRPLLEREFHASAIDAEIKKFF